MRWFALGIVFAMLATACGGGTSPSGGTDNGSPKTGGTLTVALDSELRTLDPLLST